LSSAADDRTRKEDGMLKHITLLATAMAILALLAAGGANADRAYSDPAGDSASAPDVTAVRTSHDSGGTITFVATTNQPDLAPDARIYVYIDSDRNPNTGLPIRGLGADYIFNHDGEYGTGFLFHVVGNFLMFDFESTLITGYGAGTLTARINRSDLDGVERFAFLIEAERDDGVEETTNDADFAPDAAPYFEYSLIPVSLTVGKPAGKPVAGKTFVLTAPVTRSDGDPFAAGKVTCKAKAGVTTLRTAGSIAGGAARCSMKVPKIAKGKLLRGSLTVSADDALAVTRPFSYRIG
jgi:hypothetical protein